MLSKVLFFFLQSFRPFAADTEEPMEEDIFRDLLEPAGVTNSNMGRNSRSVSAIKIFEVSDQVAKIRMGWGVLSGMLMYQNALIVISSDSSGKWLRFHKLTEGKETRSDVADDLIPYRVIKLPDRRREAPDNSKIFLCTILPYSSKGSRGPAQFSQHSLQSSLSYYISDEFYNTYFDMDLNLVDCPVLILGLKTGMLYWMPMREIPGQHGACGAHLGVLDDLGEPIQTVIFCAVNKTGDKLSILHCESKQTDAKAETTTSHQIPVPNCLLVIGHYGKVRCLTLPSVLLRHSDMSPEGKRATVTLPSPVICVRLHGHTLLHSTGRNLHLTDLRELFSQIASDTQSLTEIHLLQSLPLQICNITAMLALDDLQGSG